MQQVFVNKDLQHSDHLTLQGEVFNHLIKSLRLQIKDQFLIIDQSQQSFLAKIVAIEKAEFTVTLKAYQHLNSELPIAVTIACSLSKKDKIEWITQKTTELGVNKIIFFPSRYSIMKWKPDVVNKKTQRLWQIAKHAAQQAHRLVVPQIQYCNSLTELLQQEYDKKLVAYEESGKNNETAQLVTTFKQLQTGQSIMCLFGPEGGFAVEEIEQMVHNGYNKCGLGPRILRAETAPLYYLSALSYKFELDKDHVN